MNDVSKQQLSALMDGELAADEARFLLRRMQRNPALALTWSRYHVLRECLQGQVLAYVQADQFCERVLQQTSGSARTATRRTSRWLRVGMGGALAASVAVAALVMVQPASDVAPTATAPSSGRIAAPQIAMASTPAVIASPAQSKDFSLLLHQSGMPMLNVEPASATRSEGFYSQPSIFSQHAPPQWIVAQQSQARSNVTSVPVMPIAREVAPILRQAGNR